GDRDQDPRGAVFALPGVTDLPGRDIVPSQVDAVRTGGHGYIATRVDNHLALRVLPGPLYDFPGQGLQLACRKVLLADLNYVHAAKCGFADFFQQALPPGRLIALKLTTIGDVTKEHSRPSEWPGAAPETGAGGLAGLKGSSWRFPVLPRPRGAAAVGPGGT